MMTGKAVKRKQPLKQSTFLRSTDEMLSEIGAWRVRKNACASLVAHLYAKWDTRYCAVPYHAFPWQRRSSTTPEQCLICTTGLRNKPENAVLSIQKYDGISVFQNCHFLRYLSALSYPVNCKDRRIAQVYTTASLVELCVQLCKDPPLLFEKAGFILLSNAMVPYTWHNES